MAKIIVLSERRRMRNALLKEEDLTGFLKQAALLSRQNKSVPGALLKISGKEEFKRVLTTRFFKEAKSAGALHSSFFLCSLYIAEVIIRNIRGTAFGFWIVDYLLEHEKTQNPNFLQQGGDVCFLVCAVFPEWAERRALGKKYFERMGEMLYSSFYYATGRKIGFFMSQFFEPMVRITQKSLATLF